MKEQNGITLVALILTIVVLIILAAVSINGIQNTEIVSHAVNAGTKYNGAQTNEQTTIDNYLSYLNNVVQGNDSTNTTVTFTVDRTSYTVTEGTTWRQWGKKNSGGWYVYANIKLAKQEWFDPENGNGGFHYLTVGNLDAAITAGNYKSEYVSS